MHDLGYLLYGEAGFIINDFVVHGLSRWHFGANLGNSAPDSGEHFLKLPVLTREFAGTLEPL